MKVMDPTATISEQTRLLISETHDDIKKCRRGIEAAMEAVRRSKQNAQESLRKSRAIKSALIVK